MEEYIRWDFTMWPLAALTVFSYKKMYGHFAATKKKKGP